MAVSGKKIMKGNFKNVYVGKLKNLLCENFFLKIFLLLIENIKKLIQI